MLLPLPGIALSGAIATVALGTVATLRLRGGKKTTKRVGSREKARPQRHLEGLMVEKAFAAPRKLYGEIFASFSIWRTQNQFRMDVETQPSFRDLSALTRLLIVRHLWRTLSSMAKGENTVVIDQGTLHAIRWTQRQTDTFDDHGVDDPFAPQPESYKVAGSRAGTMLSGPPR